MVQAQERLVKREESESRYADFPIAVTLKYDADFDDFATTLQAAEKFDAHVQKQVSSSLGIPKTAGKNFSDINLSGSRDSRSIPMELTTQNFCSASYVSSARQCHCGGSAEKGDKAGRRQRLRPAPACAGAGRKNQ